MTSEVSIALPAALPNAMSTSVSTADPVALFKQTLAACQANAQQPVPPEPAQPDHAQPEHAGPDKSENPKDDARHDTEASPPDPTALAWTGLVPATAADGTAPQAINLGLISACAPHEVLRDSEQNSGPAGVEKSALEGMGSTLVGGTPGSTPAPWGQEDLPRAPGLSPRMAAAHTAQPLELANTLDLESLKAARPVLHEAAGKHTWMQHVIPAGEVVPLGTSLGSGTETGSAAPAVILPPAPVAVAEQVRHWLMGEVKHAQVIVQGMGSDPVRVDVNLQGQLAQVSFACDNPQTRGLLGASLHELSQMLAQDGLLLSGASVGQYSQGPSHRQADPAVTSQLGVDQGGTQALMTSSAPVRRQGLVDFYV